MLHFERWHGLDFDGTYVLHQRVRSSTSGLQSHWEGWHSAVYMSMGELAYLLASKAAIELYQVL